MLNRYWLSPEELQLYGVADEPERQSDFLSGRAWMHVTRPSITDPGWDWSLDNKWGFAALMAQAGVRIPTTLGLVHPTGGRAVSGRPLRDSRELAAWAREQAPAGFVIKPIDGMASRGVVLVREVRVDGGEVRFLVGDEERTAEWLLASQTASWSTRGSLLQELVAPDPAMARLGFAQPHTVRVLTAALEAGVPEVIQAALFAGRTDALINRWTGGGLSIGIGLDDGRLKRGRTLPRFVPEWFSAHPDTGIPFEGEALPGWAEIARIAREAAGAVGVHGLTVMEFVLSETGPVLLEGNRNFGLPLLQVHSDGFLQGPFRAVLDRLGATIPDGSRRWRVRYSRPARLARGAGRRVSQALWPESMPR